MWNNVPINGWPQLKGLENLTDEISGLDTRLDAVENTVGDEDSGLVKDVADIKTWINTVAPTTETDINPS